MKYLVAGLEILLVSVLISVLEFVAPSAATLVAPILVTFLALDLWRRDLTRVLLFASITLSIIPELQVNVLGPLELHHVLTGFAFLFGAVEWRHHAHRRIPTLSLALIGYGVLLGLLTLLRLPELASTHRIFVVAFFVLTAMTVPLVVRSKQHLHQLFAVLVGTSVVAALIGLVSYYVSAATDTYFANPYLHISMTEGVPRLAGTLLDSNFLGHTLLLVVPGLVVLILSAKRLRPRAWRGWLLLGTCLFVLAALWLTFSRSAYLGLGAALLVIVVGVGWRHVRRLIVVLLASLVVATALYPAFPLYSLYRTPDTLLPTSVKERLLLGFDPQAIVERYRTRVLQDPVLTDDQRAELLARDVSSDSLGYRLSFWRAALRMFKDHPIAGVGVGQFRYRFSEYSRGELEFLRQPDAHNIYVEQLAETGLLGTLGLVALLVLACGTLVRKTRQSRGLDRVVPLAILSSLVGLLVQSTLLGGLGALPIYLVIGVAAAL